MTRSDMIFSILRGLGIAILCTLIGMAILAALVVLTPMPDHLLTMLNQLLKVIAIFFGTYCAVGRGGEKGFAVGALCGLLYMVFGYLTYSILDGMLAPAPQMAVEFCLSTLIGAVSGTITANLAPRKRKRRRAGASGA